MKKTYSATMAEIARLQEAAERLRKEEVAGVITRIREAILTYGISMNDLGFSSAEPRAKRQSGKATTSVNAKPAVRFGIPKYRDPKSDKTWTGRGKPPSWIANVKNREAFAMVPNGADTASSAVVADVKASKAATTIGQPKYRDPKSGKTWTGRGKPPIWIAKAKDRDAYAIDTASLADTSSEVASAGTIPEAGSKAKAKSATLAARKKSARAGRQVSVESGTAVLTAEAQKPALA